MVDVLVIGAHPDDAELGMGASIARFREEGFRVALLDLTNGEPTPRGSVERRLAEAREAARVLGVVTRITLDLPNRELLETVPARKRVAEVIRRLRPRVLFVPYWEDAHPDHVVASRLCDSARFYSKLTRTDMEGEPYWPPRIYYYFCTHLRLHPKPAFIVDVGLSHLQTKLAALRCYSSQFDLSVGDSSPVLDHVQESARYWGRLIHREAGEPFASREEVGVVGLRGLVLDGPPAGRTAGP